MGHTDALRGLEPDGLDANDVANGLVLCAWHESLSLALNGKALFRAASSNREHDRDVPLVLAFVGVRRMLDAARDGPAKRLHQKYHVIG